MEKNQIYMIDASGEHPVTLEYAVNFTQVYKKVSKHSYERLYREFEFTFKGIDIAELLRLAGV